MAERKENKETFVGSADRPDPNIDPDRPITELRVRDLSAIVGNLTLKKWEIKEPIKEKLEKLEKPEKFEKIEKLEKFEKIEIPEKWRYKLEKPEKFEKPEKIEVDPVKRVGDQFEIPDPRVIEEIVTTLSDLSTRVGRLANQVAELEKKLG